jgi:hypothetical protein
MSTYKSLTAESLIIQDPRSKKNMRLTADQIDFYDGRGCLRMRLELYHLWDDEPRITLFDYNGRERLLLALQGTGKPYLGLADDNGNDWMGMNMTDDNTPQLFLSDANQTPRLEMIVDGDNDPELRFSDQMGNKRLVLDLADYKGFSPLRLYDADDKETYRVPVPPHTDDENKN